MAADDLGPARLFLAHSDAIAIDRFLIDTLGPLLDGRDGAGALLPTLHAFLDTGRSVRRAAATIGVLENTVRQRLDRIKVITGLDVAASADDQLSAHIAVLIARLRGTPRLPAFGR